MPHILAGPLRGELLGSEQLAKRAGEAAAAQELVAPGRRRKSAPLLVRLTETRRILNEVHDQLTDAARRDLEVGPAGEWLLDNFHVVQEHIREIRENLPKGFYRELPELASGRLAGYPRVYEVAITLISHSEARVDAANLGWFVAAYQDEVPLSIGELWSIPAMLRLALIESVRRLSLRTAQHLNGTQEAEEWAARIEAAHERGEKALGVVIEELVAGPPTLTAAFVSRFLHRIRHLRASVQTVEALEEWIADRAMSAEDAGARSTQNLALTQVMTANSITSLRTITHLDWKEFVENQSVMEASLKEDPSGDYGHMTFSTRDRYRHVVERIARRTGLEEGAVAAEAVTLAREGHGESDPVHSHVGFYLVDEGLPELERRTGYRPGFREAGHRWVRRHPNLVFVGGILAGTLAALGAVLWLAGPEARAVWLLVLLVGLIPAVDIAVSMVNQLITALLPPRTLPKLDLSGKEGIPPEFRTAVVIPTLFGSVDDVHDALDNLEVQYLANREAHLPFAVLSDFTDAPAETQEGDDAIVAAAVEGVRSLNVRYAEGRQNAFYLLHRPRRWNAQQGVWMGWERKRGKLAEFNRFVRGASADAFSAVVGDVDLLRTVRYVVTLDSDTVLPPDAAPLLVGALAHPLNRAVYDARAGRVVRGYGILQPRVGVSLPSAYRSHFAAIHSGHPGVDPYTSAVSDVYQDLYGEGSFTGKGIYEVDTFETATHGRFPENTLLSHDLIEGSYARAGLVTDISVYDDYPSRYLTFTRRKHRWIRGDWQLLDWLTPHVAGPDGPEPNRLSVLSRWKIPDNLRRSLLEIGILIFLMVGWIALPEIRLRWMVLGLAAVAAPWIISVLLAALRPPLDKSWRAYYAGIGRDLRTNALQVALAIAFLPHQAWISADAIGRTLWRLFVTRRTLLEWQTASVAEQSVSTSHREVWRAMWPAIVLALGAIIVGGLAALPLALLWAFSPIIAHGLSAPALPARRRLTGSGREDALRYAKLHWQYFDTFVTEETNWLVPDNFQEDPFPVVAMRTSPTNIGLQLLATVSAHDLGFISIAEMTRRLELAFGALERLRRFRGHFFNWYDLRDLSVLEPAYVSTVDSGNLAGHLIAVGEACLTIGDAAEVSLRTRLRTLAARANRYAMEMDFRFLFDEELEIFAIGYQENNRTLDASYYDLLASESRLASFLAIAKNDVPVDHWFRLGRTLTRTGGETALVSWSGSVFEYLMPALVMEALPYTLLDQTYRGAVRRQVAYGTERGVPWGVSESAYNLRDRHLTYQYRAFGVPDLALKRGLGHDLVIAPYASALALLVNADLALANLEALEKRGALGEYGFRDALDYTRPDPGQRFAVVGNYMAHHIGMSLVALTNALKSQIWQRRFHANAMVRSAELLLHERIPRRLVLQEPQETRPDDALPDPELAMPAVREFDSPDTPHPHIALLGRQPYTLMISHCGGGYSRYEGLAVTRWRADGTRDATGQFCYLKDLDAGRVWSAAHQPVCAPADWYRALLATDRVTFHRRDGNIETRTQIAVVPEDAAEVRSVKISNRGNEPREVEVTSYGEIVLGPPDADRAHPAFANLFVETEWHEWCTAITATRRPRSATEPSLWCVHVVDTGPERVGAVSYETDRAAFLGRGGTTSDPLALSRDGPLNGGIGAVLDPIFALRTRVRLEPGQSATVAFTTLVANTRERAFELAGRYHDGYGAQRALDLAWTSQQLELRELDLTPTDAAVFQEVAGALLYPRAELRASEEEMSRNKGSQPLLWANGVSGDVPIILASIDSMNGLPTLRQLFAAHHYWRRRGMSVELVVINTQPSSYFQELHEGIMEAMLASVDSGMDLPGGVFVRRGDQIAADELLMMRATARVHVQCDGRSLGRIFENRSDSEVEADDADVLASQPRQLEQSTAMESLAGRRVRVQGTDEALTVPSSVPGLTRRSTDMEPGTRAADDDALPLSFDNGFGGLTADGDYLVRVRGDFMPPAPWVNVIANAHGGFVVSERGGGFTWAENSFFFRLTPWHNDPVSDPVSEILYLRDEETGELWSATPAPLGHGQSYTARHGAGSSIFEHHHAGIETHLTMAMAEGAAAKLSVLRITNRDDRPRRLTVTAYAEWTLGVQREHTQHQVRTAFHADLGAITARNFFEPMFSDWVAFCALSEPVSAHTGDRCTFLGRNGSVHDPVALRLGELDGRTGPGSDPCAALQCIVELAPGETRELVLTLGAARGEDAARQLIDRYRDTGHATEAAAVSARAWDERLSVISVTTPELAFDAMLNRWSLYQALSCRIWARSALYQSSGAYGFRDQLQDVMALVYAEPAIAREHILRAASRQFVEGDVQHWWHPHSGRGVRTRISDDLAWLPYVVDQYVRVTGGASVLHEYVPFLAMRMLEPHEHEVYDLPSVTDEHASIYEHCLRALRKASTRGEHGLPLIGSGDWNDGMNRVGIEGRGESIWLAWFLTTTLRGFAIHAAARGDDEVAADLRARADAYAAAADEHGWDGEWYRRAYFDDGTPLGSAQSAECRIDSIAQSWSVISGAGDEKRQMRAMRSLEENLVQEEARVLMLLTPAFDETPLDPGYIKGYLPGVRENGAQYTHAALWAVLSTAMRGDGDRAFELYQMINPLTHGLTAEDVQTYKVEPYVVAADVYTAEGQVGRGGWTWYTGSASWMYRVGLEAILGFTKRGDTLVIDPRVPAEWAEFSITYRFGTATYAIVVRQPGRLREGAVVTLDGSKLEGAEIPLVDDGERHSVIIDVALS